MKSRSLTRQEVEAQPFRIWIAFVNLLAMEEYCELSQEERPTLGLFGVRRQQKILQEAGELWVSQPRSPVQTAQEFCNTALEGEFESFNSRFHACAPNLQESLEAYL